MRIISIVSLTIFCISLWTSAAQIFDGYFMRRCPTHKCQNNTKSNTYSDLAGCKCDVQCHLYGDCCQDAPMAPNMNFSSLPVVNCSSIPSIPFSIYTVSWCEPSRKMAWKKCQLSSNYTEQVSNPFVKVPVTDLSTNITYGNWNCARCQNISTSYAFWSLNLTCPSLNGIITMSKLSNKDPFHGRPSLNDKVKFNNETNRWQLTTDDKQNENCTLIPVLPPASPNTSAINVRRCETNVVSNCTSLTKLLSPSDCPGFIAYVTDQKRSYRNEKCALCNKVSTTFLSCKNSALFHPMRRRFTLPSFRISLNTTTASVFSSPNITSSATSSTVTPSSTTSSIVIPSSTTAASLSNSTTRVTSSFTSSSAESPSDAHKGGSNYKKRAYIYLQFNTDCRLIMNQMNFTKVIAETVYYRTMNRTFVKSTKKIEGAAIEVCDMSKEVSQTEYERDSQEYSWFAFTYITYDILLLVSVILNVIYLYMYVTSRVSNTLYSKALANFASILFLAHLGSILNSISTLTRTMNSRFCLLHYVLEYYGHLAARFWLVSIAFEMTTSIWEIGSGSPVSGTDESWTRFTVYSWLSWLVPGILVATNLSFGLNISTNMCSLTYDIGLHNFLLHSSITVSASMTSAFYLSSLHVIRTQSGVVEKLSQKYGISFSLYTSLIICATFMNLSNFVNNDLLLLPGWFLFSGLNCLLATLICLQSPVQNILLNKLKLHVDKYFKIVCFCE